MLVFVTPKLDSKRIPYSYRARATIPASHIKDSRVTDDINSLHPDYDIAVLGKKHSKEDVEYLISKEINYIVDIADDKFDQFKHWRFTIPNANAVTTTCHRLREVIQEETGSKSYVIPDPTERPRGTPKFELKDIMNAFYYGSDGNYSKIMWPEIETVLNKVRPTDVKIMTNKPKYPPKAAKISKKYGGFWMTPDRRKQVEDIGMKQHEDLIPWDFDKQGELVEQSDFVILPVTDDRHSQCKGNNRPIDALQQGRIVLTNPSIPSYEDLEDVLFIDHFYEAYTDMIDNPKMVISKIQNAQKLIDQHYTPKAVAKKWEQIYEIVKRNDI
tara:strand:- start:299 stop:1282 length:984 start_codon:yes stop_codon:yes gene_type:complete